MTSRLSYVTPAPANGLHVLGASISAAGLQRIRIHTARPAGACRRLNEVRSGEAHLEREDSCDATGEAGAHVQRMTPVEV